jgi:hypothetical protein
VEVLVVPPADVDVVAPGVVVVVAPPVVEGLPSSGTVVVESGTMSGSKGSRGCDT